jgi:formiminotetrahydrofolate cyclodeaminase
MHLTSALVDYAEACAARKSTPGGGSASALVGAVGASLGEMAATFTSSCDDPSAVEEGLDQLRRVREAVLPLVDLDCEAYKKVGAALALPKDSSAAKRVRRERLQAALAGSLDVPLRCARLCVEGLEILDGMAEHLNPNLVTDTACAALFLTASFRASWYNVEVNLKVIKKGEGEDGLRTEGKDLARRATELQENILKKADVILAG